LAQAVHCSCDSCRVVSHTCGIMYDSEDCDDIGKHITDEVDAFLRECEVCDAAENIAHVGTVGTDEAPLPGPSPGRIPSEASKCGSEEGPNRQQAAQEHMDLECKGNGKGKRQNRGQANVPHQARPVQTSDARPLAAESRADDEATLLDALEELIESNDGALPGTAFEKLYGMKEPYREIVKSCGGPKKLAEFHSERFYWCLEGRPGGSIRLVDRSSKQSGSAASWHQDFRDAANTKWESSNWYSRTAYSGYGTSEEPKGASAWTQKWENHDGKPHRPESLRDALVELLDSEQGALLLSSKVFPDIKQQWPNLANHFQQEAQDAGGLKAYVTQFPKLFCWVSDPDIPGRDAVQSIRGRSQLAAEYLVSLVKWHAEHNTNFREDEGMLASHIQTSLCNWDRCKADLLRSEVQLAGGISKFIDRHVSDRVEWYFQSGDTTEVIRLVKDDRPSIINKGTEHWWQTSSYTADSDQVSTKEADDGSAWTAEWNSQGGEKHRPDCLKDALVKMVDFDKNGVALSSKIFPYIKQQWPDLASNFQKDAQAAGGLKAYIMQFPNLFRWVSDPDHGGRDAVHRVDGGSELAAEYLVSLVKWHAEHHSKSCEDEGLLASQIHRFFRNWDRSKADLLRNEVQLAGGIKKFIVSNVSDRLEWYLQKGTGTEAIRLVQHGRTNRGTDRWQQLTKYKASVEPRQPLPSSPPAQGMPNARKIVSASLPENKEPQELLWDAVQEAGGTMLAARVYGQLQDRGAWIQETVRQEVENAGGLKNYIKKFPILFDWFLEGGVGTEAIRAKIPASPGSGRAAAAMSFQ